MPVVFTQTQKNYVVDTIEVRHINPSIMEGERGHTSMFGARSAVPIVRYAPTFLIVPSISGSFKIPSVLTCNPGVIDASPQAQVFYQWKANGVDIPGEITNMLTTSLFFDSALITCEVDAVNLLGTAQAESNGITAELVESINNWEYSVDVVSGLNQYSQINGMNMNTIVATGLAMDSRLDNQALVANILTGLGIKNANMFYNHDVAVIWQPTRLADLPLINPSANTGDLTGWTVTEGSIAALTISSFGNITPFEGTHYFGDQESTQPSSSSMFQTVALNASDIAEAVDGTLMCNHMFTIENRLGQNGVQVTVQYLSSADVVLGTTTEGLLINTQNRSWRHQFNELEYVPSGTEKINVIVFFNNLGNTAVGYSSIDDISVRLHSDT